MKLIVDTQRKENYGAHTWDGEGACPQYWKFKGGSTYVVENVAPAQADEVFQQIKRAVEHSSESFAEYIIGHKLAEDYEATWEDWDLPYILEFTPVDILVKHHYTYDEFSYWDKCYRMTLDGDRIEGSYQQTPANDAARKRQAEWEASKGETP